MSANTQRDGRPAEYRWHPLFNAAKPDKVMRWCADVDFLPLRVLHLQRAACSTFQTCILNSP